jgi:site-specific DNA-methyltransferase (adenine-specific)
VHPDKNLQAIRDSLQTFGQQKPLVVTTDGLIVAGNGAWQAARQLGWTEIAVQVTTLDPAMLKAYAVADNRTGDLSVWDDDTLSATLKALQDDALPLIGWDEADLRNLWPQTREGAMHDAVPQLDHAAALHAQYGVEVGQLWACGAHRVLCGDCTDTAGIERLLGRQRLDALCTDPPYSSGGQFRSDRSLPTATKYVQSDSHATYRGNFSGDNRDQHAFLTWASLWISAAFVYSKPGAICLVFTDWRQLPTMSDALQCGGWVWRNLVTWWKPGIRMQRGRFSLSAEYVLYGSNGVPTAGETSPQNVLQRMPVDGEAKQHIAEKPVALLEDILGVTVADGLIYDPFLGAGSTLIACEHLGRRCYGIDIDPAYVAVALERWAQVTGQTPVLVEG